MAPKFQKIHFPVWQYLCQPIFDQKFPAILNPRRYWNLYRVQHLEKCWMYQYKPEKRSQN